MGRAQTLVVERSMEVREAIRPVPGLGHDDLLFRMLCIRLMVTVKDGNQNVKRESGIDAQSPSFSLKPALKVKPLTFHYQHKHNEL